MRRTVLYIRKIRPGIFADNNFVCDIINETDLQEVFMDKLILPLKNRCRFHLGNVPDAWQTWFDDSDWQEVSLPHDWSVSLPFSREYSSGTGYLAGGIGWYRIRIAPDEAWRGKRISLAFDGVYKNSRVWCNSYYLGCRPFGYISFSYDITEQFRFDRDNIISVCVDHRDISDSRWFTGSGITRKVSLVVEEAVHPVENGIFFSASLPDSEKADIPVQNEMINECGQTVNVTVTNCLISPEKETAASASTTITLENGKTGRADNRMTVSSPALWSTDSPSLYTLQTSVSYTLPDGTVTEYTADIQKVGIRGVSFHPDRGLFLNGQPVLLKGVCVHHDAGCLGAAVLPAVWRRRLRKLKTMGCNAIRMSHNPHMPELYDLCDEMGFLVMDEAFDEWEGPKNKWWHGHNVYPPRNEGYFADFPQWHRQDLRDLIRRDRNHPCVVLWSIGNEIDYPNDPYCHPSFSSMTGNNDANKPLQERMYNPDRPDARRLAVLSARLSAIVRENDPTRPVTLAAAFPELSSRLGFLDPLDVIGYNYKEQLYEESHRRFPEKAILGSENSHSLAAWKAVLDNEYISGQFLWTGIDYLGEASGWPVHGSGAGLLTLAGFEKPGYYRRQSFWSDAPMLHLVTAPSGEGNHEFSAVSEIWNYPAGEAVLVKCYTNLPEVSFFLNGELLKTLQKEENKDCISLTVPFVPGTLEARAVLPDGWNDHSDSTEPASSSDNCSNSAEPADSHPGEHIISDSLTTTGCACQIHLSCPDACHAAEDDIYQIEAELQDYAGRRVYTGSTLLTVEVRNGRLLGLENGDLADITDYSSHSRRAYRGQLLILVAPEAENSAPVVTVSGELIKTARMEF